MRQQTRMMAMQSLSARALHEVIQAILSRFGPLPETPKPSPQKPGRLNHRRHWLPYHRLGEIPFPHLMRGSNNGITFGPMMRKWLWIFVVGVTLATTLPLKGEGGILLYTAPGTPFADCVRYKKLLTPAEGLLVAVKPDGTNVRVSDRAVVANIPNPSPDSGLDAAAISELVKLCDLQAIRQPKHAGLINMTGDLWRRELEKVKSTTPPAEQTPPQVTPHTAPATARTPPANASKEATAKAEPVDVAKQLKDIRRLIDLKKWKELAALCQGLANSTEDELRQFGELGTELSSAIEALDVARKEEPQAAAEATRIRQNADVTGRPNLLRPGDTSGMQRAQAMRTDADALEWIAKMAIKTAEGRISHVASLISLKTLSPDASMSINQQANPAEVVGTSDRAKNGRPFSEHQSQLVPNTKVKPPPKGPSLEFKSFSLNLSKTELLQVLKQRFEADTITHEDKDFKEHLLFKGVSELSITRCFINGEKFCEAIWDASGQGHMLRLHLYDPYLSVLFNSKGLSFDDFVTRFITAYGIPKMKGKHVAEGNRSFKTYWYNSGLGWYIEIRQDDPNFNWSSMSIHLFRAEPEPPKPQTTFGD